jgi:hypothetical protein
MPHMVTQSLIARRYAPVVVFDFSIHRYLTSRQLDEIGDISGLVVAPQGTTADAILLDAVSAKRTQIVTNDRYHDWRKTYPTLRNDTLVSGQIAKGGHVRFSKKLRPAPL